MYFVMNKYDYKYFMIELVGNSKKILNLDMIYSLKKKIVNDIFIEITEYQKVHE